MNIIGLDYGERKIGISRGETESKFAEPLDVIRYIDEEVAMERIFQLAQIEKADKVVIGISEGKTAQKTKDFSLKLKRKLAGSGIIVEFWDETLSTKMAQELSIQSGMKRKKRRRREDAFAASYMLQDYLEKT